MRRDNKRLFAASWEPAFGRYGTLHCSEYLYVCLKVHAPFTLRCQNHALSLRYMFECQCPLSPQARELLQRVCGGVKPSIQEP